MHEDDELKTQCFGGDYMGEVFDNNLKRMQFRRQKRWWNAYMLFYTRCDVKFTYEKSQKEQLSLAESRNFILPMPEPIERSVRIQNTRFLHLRSIFTMEFFNFIRKLMSSSAPPSRVDVLVSNNLFMIHKNPQLNAVVVVLSDTTNGGTFNAWSSAWHTISLSLGISHKESYSRCCNGLV